MTAPSDYQFTANGHPCPRPGPSTPKPTPAICSCGDAIHGQGGLCRVCGDLHRQDVAHLRAENEMYAAEMTSAKAAGFTDASDLWTSYVGLLAAHRELQSDAAVLTRTVEKLARELSPQDPANAKVAAILGKHGKHRTFAGSEDAFGCVAETFADKKGTFADVEPSSS